MTLLAWIVLLVNLVGVAIAIRVLLEKNAPQGPSSGVHYCSYCQARFLGPRGLALHMQATHPEVWEVSWDDA